MLVNPPRLLFQLGEETSSEVALFLVVRARLVAFLGRYRADWGLGGGENTLSVLGTPGPQVPGGTSSSPGRRRVRDLEVHTAAFITRATGLSRLFSEPLLYLKTCRAGARGAGRGGRQQGGPRGGTQDPLDGWWRPALGPTLRRGLPGRLRRAVCGTPEMQK